MSDFNYLDSFVNGTAPIDLVERQDMEQEKAEFEAKRRARKRSEYRMAFAYADEDDQEQSDTLDENFDDEFVQELLPDDDPPQADSGQGDTNVPEKLGIDVLDSFLPQIKEVSFSEYVGESGKKGHNSYYIGSVASLLEIAREHQWDIGMRNDAPYFYTGKHWQRIEPQVFRCFLQAVGIRQGIPSRVIKDHLFVDKLEKQFASEARFPVLSTNGTPKINLRNGTLHFTSDGVELKPFDKQDGLVYQLDYDYNPKARCPLFSKFINRVLSDVALQKLVFQYIGYVFLRNMRLEKVLFLHGSGANGKSVLLNTIRALVGVGQCCEYSLEGVTKEAYQRAELGNYLLNVCTEISTRMGTAYFKKIASREPLDARYPYGKPFTVWDYATSIFAMNELPKDVEQTDAFFRRFIVIPFNVRIPDNEQDPDLTRKIIEGEMSGVLNWVIRGMQSLLDEGQFDIPESVRMAVEKFRQESDSVLSFFVEDGYQISHEHWKPLGDIYLSYRGRCSADGRQAVSKPTFSRRLRELGYTVEKKGRDKQTMVNTENDADRDTRCRQEQQDHDEVPY